MLKRLLEGRIEAFEKAFGYDASYMKEVLAVSRKAFTRLARLQTFAGHNEGVPAAAWYAAKLVATRHEDCGPCTQLVADMASKAGVPATTLRAIVTGDEMSLGGLDADALLGYRFACEVLARSPNADELRAEVVRRFGQRGLVSLAFGLAGSRLYPTLKYALGHGHACRTVRLPGEAGMVVSVGAAA